MLTILDPGALTTVQDAGRVGWGRYGIPPSGPMDATAFVAANRLVGNPARAAALEITDNGRGFPIGRAGRLDSYGLMGMRERASSIGASLQIASQEGTGTRVRCTLHRVDTPNPAPPRPEPAKL